MKITISPLSQVKLRAERAVNFHRVVTPQDLAHGRKRQLAQSVRHGDEPTTEFIAAAEIEGKAPEVLADIILSKPDIMMQAENARRAIIVQIRVAQSAEEVKAILQAHRISDHPDDRSIEMV